MHDIEPFFKWRNKYIASEDERSPFHGKVYDEFTFRNKVYNYFIHPQWDSFGTETLYIKVLFVDYDNGQAVIELLGEWNDCLHNDIMFLKRNLLDKMIDNGIFKFVLCCENVLNFHASDESYYQEWFEDIAELQGWICMLDVLDHVYDELKTQQIHHYVNYGRSFNHTNWRLKKPEHLFIELETVLNNQMKSLY